MKTTKIYLLLFAFFVTAIMPASIFAGDFATLNFIGFSEDGKYLAFEEYGTQDGIGFPYSTYYFIETAKNSYAAAPVKMTVKEGIDEDAIPSEDAIRLTAKKSAAANLKKFKIVTGNTGVLLAARLPTDINVEKLDQGSENKNQTIKFYGADYEGYTPNFFELSLKSSASNSKRCQGFGFDDTLKFELSLKDSSGGTSKILQKDKDLPESRGCVNAYSVQNIYTFKDKIAVFINNYSYGFEGPDMRYMVVTGNFK